MKKLLLLFAITLVLSSCATIFTGTRQSITFESNVKEVDVLTVDGNRHRNISFPYVMQVRKGFNRTIVQAEKDGVKSEVTTINKDFNPVTILNVLNGTFGFAIDAATGAMMQTEFTTYDIYFPSTPEEPKDTVTTSK